MYRHSFSLRRLFDRFRPADLSHQTPASYLPDVLTASILAAHPDGELEVVQPEFLTKQWRVPGNQIWLVSAATWTYTATATVGSRELALTYTPAQLQPAIRFWASHAATGITASQIILCHLRNFPLSQQLNAPSVNNMRLQILPPFFALPGTLIEIFDGAGIDSADLVTLAHLIIRRGSN